MKKMISKTKGIILLATVMILISATGSFAMMGDQCGGCGMTAGGGGMMTKAGGFGMMNGLAGVPVVDTEGTAYIVSMTPSTTPGNKPKWKSFMSHILAVSPSGQILDLTLDGLISRPIISENTLIATASLPNMGNYSIITNYGTTTAQSVLFFLQLPLSSSSVPDAVQMDGRYASVPVIANNQIYVTTTNFGYGMMMGNDVFNDTFPNYHVRNTDHAYLYVFTMDGTLVSKTVLQ